VLIGCQSMRRCLSFLVLRAVVPCVEKLRTVLTVGIRDGVVRLVSILGSVDTSARKIGRGVSKG
jgi:hypothetical protein